MKNLIILLSILALSTNNKKYYDIKGNVNKPGVYEIKENYTIKDAIEVAGGLKKNSYTDNINLSKKVTDEMVIYIFSNKEISKIKEINSCICKPTYKYIECDTKINNNEISTTTTTTTTTNKITTTNTIPQSTTNTTTKNIHEKEEIKLTNINTATLEELEKIKGIGSTKAKNIIEYRTTNGLFKTIEELLKVNGIGNATFEKIKEYITV